MKRKYCKIAERSAILLWSALQLSLFSSLSDAVRDGACEFLDNLGNGVDFARQIIPGASSSDAIVDLGDGLLVDIPFVNVPRALSALVCNRAPQPEPAPVFTGGQCDGVRYRVNLPALFVDGDCSTSPRNYSVELWGPITFLGYQNLGSCPPGCTGSQCFQGWRFRCRGTVFQNPLQPGLLQDVFVTDLGVRQYQAGSDNISVVRLDGQPDDCGNSDRTIVPRPVNNYQNITINNFTFVDDNGTTINLGDLNLVYLQPNIDINGRFNIPVRVDVGGINLNGRLNVDGTVNIDIGGIRFPSIPGRNPSSPEPDEEPEPTPIDTPTPLPPEPPDPNERRTIVAALVTTTMESNSVATKIAQFENPDIFAPSLGYINFLYKVGTVSAAWSEDIPIKNKRQLVVCPWRYGAVDVKGTPRPGVTWEIIPVFDLAQVYSPVES